MTHYYLLGAGGIGMSALGLVLRSLGHEVSGGDLAESTNVAQLRERGAIIDVPENPSRLEPGMEVVFSTDILMGHPVLKRARELELSIDHRSDLLAQLIAPFRQLVVTGSHGKTTTTSLLLHLLSVAGCDPTYFVGSHLPGYLHGHLGSGEFAVLEGDESDGSFLKTDPAGAIITNIGNDHLSYWGSVERLKEGFQKFFSQVKGPTWICIDNPEIASLGWTAHTYGFSDGAELQIKNARPTEGGMMATLGRADDVYIPLMGHHNLLNAAAVFGLGLSLGFEESLIRKAFKSFRAPLRRQEWIGDLKGVSCYSDYAHHPNEIRATIQAFKSAFPERRLCLLFQPHRFSRLKYCWDQYADSFGEADLVCVTDIYAACEKKIENMTGEALARTLSRPAHYIEEGHIFEELNHHLKPGDLLVAMGAGSIDQIIRRYVGEKLCV